MQTKQNDMNAQRSAGSAFLAHRDGGRRDCGRGAGQPLCGGGRACCCAPVGKVEPARAAPSSAEACNTLEDLHAALLALEDFPLKKTASNLCFADGNLQADMMVIGDVPGRDEDIEGKVFAGQNALLLEKMLGAIGSVSRVPSACLISFRGGHRETARRRKQKSRCASPFILRAIELCRPKFILCLGGQSGSAPVRQERRAAFTSRQMV